MKNKNSKLIKEEEKSHVKLYKTKHGWFSCLSRAFKWLKTKLISRQQNLNSQDIDDLDDSWIDDIDAYKQGAAALLTTLGIGTTIVAAPKAVEAAKKTVKHTSMVIGSQSSSNTGSMKAQTMPMVGHKKFGFRHFGDLIMKIHHHQTIGWWRHHRVDRLISNVQARYNRKTKTVRWRIVYRPTARLINKAHTGVYIAINQRSGIDNPQNVTINGNKTKVYTAQQALNDNSKGSIFHTANCNK